MTLHQRRKKLKVIMSLKVACRQVWVKCIERMDYDAMSFAVVKKI